MSYKPYYTNGWKSGEAGGTPITPEALNHMEAGIEAAGTHMDSTSNPHKVTAAQVGAAAASHGNHVPATQTANNAIFLRNDNTWQKVTPANIGAAASSHGNHVPATQTANNATFLRNDNSWQKVTPANIGAAASSHNHAAGNITSGTLSLARGGTGSSGTSVSSASNSHFAAHFAKFGNLVVCTLLPKASVDTMIYESSLTIPSGYRPSGQRDFTLYSYKNKNNGGDGTVYVQAYQGGSLKASDAYGLTIGEACNTYSWIAG